METSCGYGKRHCHYWECSLGRWEWAGEAGTTVNPCLPLARLLSASPPAEAVMPGIRGTPVTVQHLGIMEESPGMLNKWHQIHGPWTQTANVQIILHPTQTAGDIRPCLRLRLVLAASSTQCIIPTIIHSVPCGLHTFCKELWADNILHLSKPGQKSSCLQRRHNHIYFKKLIHMLSGKCSAVRAE